MIFAEKYTREELMVSVCSHFIKDYESVFVGIGIPLLAASVAVRLHAPNAVLLFEGGGIGPITRRTIFSVGDNSTTDNALVATDLWRVLGDVQRGFIDLGVIGGAQIDRYGNVNSTVILGDGATYERPVVRLGGAGGANDIASSAKRFIIIMRLEKRRFVERLDYLTSPGYLGGGKKRKEMGLRGGGPEAVITSKCVLKFDPVTKEMFLDQVFPGVSVEEIKENIDWDLKINSFLKETRPPLKEEIEAMHTIDPMGILLGSKSRIESGSFGEYYEVLKAAYESIVLPIW